MRLESAIRRAVWLWCSFFLKRLLTCPIWIPAHIRIIPSEEEGRGKGGQIFLLKLGLWGGGVFLNHILMSVCNKESTPVTGQAPAGLEKSARPVSEAIRTPWGRALLIAWGPAGTNVSPHLSDEMESAFNPSP